IFHRQVQSLMPIAFRADQHELARAVGLEHGRCEHSFDDSSLEIMKLLGADNERFWRERSQTSFFEGPRECIQRVGISDYDIRAIPIQASQELRYAFLTQVKRIEDEAAVQAIVEVVLAAPQPRDFAQADAPQVELFRSGRS